MSNASDPKHIFTTPTIVEATIAKLPLRKAPGPDGIPNVALRHLRRKGIVALTNIFNAAFQLRYFPYQWKIADVIMLPKPNKNRTFPQNYRPISLLNTMGKLFEKLLLGHLQEWVDQVELLPSTQHGFRAGHSTEHQLLRVTEYISKGFHWGYSTCAVFLDVEKAFDKVWHEGLVYKLIHQRAPTWLIMMLHSFLGKRAFRVKIGNVTSSLKQIEAGVPQGSTLSPLLYNIYTHDIPKAPRDAMVAQYADDTAILSRSARPTLASKRLQTVLDEVEHWYARWRINVNATKSTAVHFTRRNNNRKPTRRDLQDVGDISIFGDNIPWEDSAKYLGVTLDKRLQWKEHVDTAINKAKAATAAIYPLIHRRSKVGVNNKLLLYKTIIRPMMVYAAPIWGYAGSTVTQKMQVLQNQHLRMAVDAPWYIRNASLHKDLKVPTIEDHIRNAAEKFFAGAQQHDNKSVVEALQDYDDLDKIRHKRPKMLVQDQS